MWKSIEETKKTPFLFFLSWIMMNFHDARSEIRERRGNRRVAMVTERTERTD